MTSSKTAPTLVPGAKPEEPYHRLSAGNRQPPTHLSELIDSRGESRTFSTWAALRPDAFERFFAFLDPHFAPETGTLPLAERRLIAVVISAENRCTGCTLVNTQRLASDIDDPERARRIAINYRSVSLSPRERTIADFAVTITQEPWSIESRHLDGLREMGLSDDEIMEVIEIAALLNLTNRISSAIGSRPDPSFFDEAKV